jgi:AmiR/NasT family two-component response regulator
LEIAKGILMREMNLTEADSYGYIRKKSQDEKRKMVEVARRVIASFGTDEEREKFLDGS